jgi:hypothetical protein
VFALVSDRFQPALNSEVPGRRLNSRVQIFSPEYLGAHAFQKYGVLETFVCLIMFLHKKQVMVPPVTPERAGRRPNQKFDHYIQNSSEKQLNIRMQSQKTADLKKFSHSQVLKLDTSKGVHRSLPHIHLGMSKVCLTNKMEMENLKKKKQIFKNVIS